MELEKKLIASGTFQIQKFSGKMGWSYIQLETLSESQVKQLNMQLVDAEIDQLNFEQLRLMPLGDGSLFIPLKKEIRKELGKEAGDKVKASIYIPLIDKIGFKELKECLEQDELPSWRYFMLLNEDEQQNVLNRLNRILKPSAQAEEILSLGKELKARFYSKKG